MIDNLHGKISYKDLTKCTSLISMIFSIKPIVLDNFMPFNYSQALIKGLSKQTKLRILKNVKDTYIERFNSNYSSELCSAFIIVLQKKFSVNCNYRKIMSQEFPEFNPDFLTGKRKDMNENWWEITDFESRIKAMDILINLYSL